MDWQVTKTTEGRTLRIAGSGGTKGFAVGYYDACLRMNPEGEFGLIRVDDLVEINRGKAQVRMPASTKRWRVRILEGDEFVQVAEGNKPYCYGFFYGISDHKPSPKVQLASPTEKTADERGPYKAPVPQ